MEWMGKVLTVMPGEAMAKFHAWLGTVLLVALLAGDAAAIESCPSSQPCDCIGPRYPLLTRLWLGRPQPPAPTSVNRNQSPYGTPAFAWGYFATPTVHATQQWDYYHDWKEWTLPAVIDGGAEHQPEAQRLVGLGWRF